MRLFFLFAACLLLTAPVTGAAVLIKPGPRPVYFVKITVQQFRTITGRKPTLTERAALFCYNHRLIKLKPNGDLEKGKRLGKKSLRLGIIGWGLLLLGLLFTFPLLFFVSLGFYIGSVIAGIASLKEKKGDGRAIAGIIMSGLPLALFVIGALAVLVVLIAGIAPVR
jgi:hypothetical protein